MGALNPAQVICYFGFQRSIGRLAEIVGQQYIFGRNRGIGFQFEHPVSVRLTGAEQRTGRRGDARLEGFTGSGPN